jgi:hypothetical protein
MHLGIFINYGLMATLELYVPYFGMKKWVPSFPSFSLSDTRFLFQNHTLVTGGEDGKINSWPIHPVELETDELIDGEELMDVDMPSTIGRKRERDGDNEFVRAFFSSRVLFSH